MDETVIRLTLDIGEKMLQSGGEVSRVENTIERILKAYGFGKVDVFTITSQIQVAAVDAEGNSYSQFRRIHTWGTNLTELERLNQISLDICQKPPEPEALEALLRQHGPREPRRRDTLIAYLGAILASSGFTVFFGGGMEDAAVTALLACMITGMNRHSHFKSENQLLYYFLFSIVTGLVGNLLVWAGGQMGLHMALDKILIGCVMLTIPGIAITYAVRDMLLGEVITGLLRFAESVLIATSIAAGYILSSMIVGGVLR